MAFYEGYDTNNRLVYFFSQKTLISEDELEFIFKEKKYIYKFVMHWEKIELIYNRENKHLTIENINKKNEDLL